MKAKTLQIHWHDRQPIFSIDFEPTGKGRLATAGGDENVRIWKIIKENNEPPHIEYLSSLNRHTAAVNVVRFSPKGAILASAGDDGNIILWQQSEQKEVVFGEEEDNFNKETWRIVNMLRGSSDIYDIAWSPDAKYILSGAIDNTAKIWDVKKNAIIYTISDHSHFVQGVAWDPLGEYIATQSSDRYVNVYSYHFKKNGAISITNIGKYSKMEMKQRNECKKEGDNQENVMETSEKSQNEANNSTNENSLSNNENSMNSTHPTHENDDDDDNNKNITNNETNQNKDDFEKSTSNQQNVVASPIKKISTTNLTPTNNSMLPPPPSPKRNISSTSPVISPLTLSTSPCYISSNSPTKISPSNSSSSSSNSNNTTPVSKPQPKSSRIYHDETLTSFFRRLSFTSDGSLLLTPAGQYRGCVLHVGEKKEKSPNNPIDLKNTVYIYTRGGLNRLPMAHLPGHKKPAIAVRCNPVKYKLRQYKQTEASDKTNTFIQLPYRLVYAVATQDSVLIYDTQQTTPIVLLTNLHYATFTDLAWSYDGCTLMLASTDGYCSIVSFEKNELGEPLTEDNTNDTIQATDRSFKTIIATIPSNIAMSPSETLQKQISDDSIINFKNNETEALQKFITPPGTPGSSLENISNKRQIDDLSDNIKSSSSTDQSSSKTNNFINQTPMSMTSYTSENSSQDVTNSSQNKTKKRRITPQLISKLN